MTIFGVDFRMGALWLCAALAFAIAELIAPGFFLIFVGAGAALTGLTMLIAPNLPTVAQALLFALFSGVAIALGWRWYRSVRHTAAPTGLNDRTAKLVGETVEVSEAIVSGQGRVRVGDGAWNARGPDMPIGALVRVIGASGSVLLVEPA
jgi:membrane protein implicated in regulation of membrane protease activity